MIDPISAKTQPVFTESYKEWNPFFNQFLHPVEDKQKKQIIESLTLELSRQIQHHLKKMKEHYKKLREDNKK